MTTTTESDASTPVTLPRLALYGTLAAVLATAVNAAVRVGAIALFDVPPGFGPLAWAPVVNTTVVAGVGATAVYGLLVRVSTRPNRTFAGIALVLLVLSFVPLVAPPAFLAGAPASVLVTLGAMHVTTAAVVLGLVPRAGTGGVGSR